MLGGVPHLSKDIDINPDKTIDRNVPLGGCRKHPSPNQTIISACCVASVWCYESYQIKSML